MKFGSEHANRRGEVSPSRKEQVRKCQSRNVFRVCEDQLGVPVTRMTKMGKQVEETIRSFQF